jgi:transposase InsO family protein
MKKGILEIIDSAVKQGVTLAKACLLIQIDERRLQRWRNRGARLEDKHPGPLNAPHALLSEEKEAICKFALDPSYVDDSHRVLAAKGADENLFYASASSIYKVMRENDLTADRSGKSHKSGRSRAPERLEIVGPNQRWCWDITYCHTNAKGVFLYLFAILDEYSRKVIAWRISWHMNHKEAMELLQDGLENEGITDIDVKLPDLINDRGTQMKAKAFMAMCRDLGIEQKFARPRTPNDNPFIESLFSIVKGYHSYPEIFADDIAAITYFTAFFEYYNNARYHGEIGFVTPTQKHTGLDKCIIKRRADGLTNAKQNRMQKNRNAKLLAKVDNALVKV